MLYQVFIIQDYVCLKPSMPSVINPYWLICIINHNFLKILVIKNNLYLSKTEGLVHQICREELFRVLAYIWKVFFYKVDYGLLEFTPDKLHLLRISYICHSKLYLINQLIPYLVKNQFSVCTYLGDINIVYQHKLILL